MKAAAIPQRAAANLKTRFFAAHRDRVGRVSLELDRIRASVLGGMENPDRLIEILIVIGGKLGNDIGWAIGPNGLATNLDSIIRRCRFHHSLPRTLPRTGAECEYALFFLRFE